MRVLPLSLSALLLLSSCFPPPSDLNDPKKGGDEVSPFHIDLKGFVKANNAFALRFYQEEAKKGSQNFLFSPYSMTTNLAMLWMGAYGKTREQITELAGWQTLARDPFLLGASFYTVNRELDQLPEEYQVRSASALWASPSLNLLDSYTQMTEDSLGPVTVIDTTHIDAALSTINYWTAKQTDGQIQALLSAPEELPKEASFLLTSALSLKAPWNVPLDGEHPQRLRFVRNDRFSALLLPFFSPVQARAEIAVRGEGYLSCFVLLPHTEEDFTWMEAHLAEWRDWRFSMEVKKVVLNLPSFTLEGRYDNKEPFFSLGIPLAFDPERADFSAMTDQHQIALTSLVHACRLTFDANGVNGASASTMTSFDLFANEPSLPIALDRPFLLMILHEPSDLILFLGRYSPS